MTIAECYPGPQRPMLAAQLRLASEASHHVVLGHVRERGFTDLRQSHFDLFRFPGPHGRTPTQLAAHVRLSKQALNPLLNELEAHGYLTRVSGQHDRRSRTLQLTPRGFDLVTAIREALERLEARIAEALGDEGYGHLLNGLHEVSNLDTTDRIMAAPTKGRARDDRTGETRIGETGIGKTAY